MDDGHPHRHGTPARHQRLSRSRRFAATAQRRRLSLVSTSVKTKHHFGDFNSQQLAVHSRGCLRIDLQLWRRKTRSSLIHSGPPHIRLPVFTQPRTFCPFCRRSGSEWKRLGRISVPTTGWRWNSKRGTFYTPVVGEQESILAELGIKITRSSPPPSVWIKSAQPEVRGPPAVTKSGLPGRFFFTALKKMSKRCTVHLTH